MSDTYDFAATEKKWIARWRAKQRYEPDLDNAQRPYYNLMMFPYPSAEGLHAGNLFAYVGSDIQGRWRRAQGYDVFEPMGFDAFGIHSENYALKTGRHPAELVPENIIGFTKQLERAGLMLDWRQAVDTTDPTYYRWTQWIFLQLYRAGLVYQKEAPVHWCPSCRTVLANEQAADGVCERCASPVEAKRLRQWFARITAYAQRLLDNLEEADWSEVTKAAQRRWIGRSPGARVRFAVEASDAVIETFTTRPDTLWGVTYLALAPQHELVGALTTPQQRRPVQNFVENCQAKTPGAADAPHDFGGVFTGCYARNPADGRAIPIWIAAYVEAGYGTGAVMAVPAHDQRDWDFAHHHGLPVRQVIQPHNPQAAEEPHLGAGTLINSGPFSGLDSTSAKDQIAGWLEKRGAGGATVNYRLRDWCLSRQRYWGPPIPIVHCDTCGAVAVDEQDLPVKLPPIQDFKPDGSGQSPLARDADFIRTACPRCNAPARRECDVSDNFLDSAWYFLRYPSAQDPTQALDPERTARWLPVDLYIGGNEHAVLHLMYTRFITMALKDLGLIDFEEPFKTFRANGMIRRNGAKMSKSKGNVVNPDDYFDTCGADAFRLYLMFSGNFQEGGDFRDGGIAGVQRFLDRVWRYATSNRFTTDAPEAELTVLMHRQTDKINRAFEAQSYNTAVAALMEYFSALQTQRQHSLTAAGVFLQLLAPMAPFIAHELWQRLGLKHSVADAPWPQSNPTLLQPEAVWWVVQINGKMRGRLHLAPDADQGRVEAAFEADERLAAWTAGKEIRQTIFVPGKLINFVV
jgi:leucyl-tRNA synthetase